VGLRMCSPYRPKNSGFYWVRKRVPDDLRPIMGKRELKRSLKTADPKEAKIRALAVCTEIDQLLANARRSLTMGAAEIDALQGEYFRTRVEAITTEAQRDQWTPEHFEILTSQLLDIPDRDIPGHLDEHSYEEHRTLNAANWGMRAAQKLLNHHNLAPPPLIGGRLQEKIFSAEISAYTAAYARIYGDPSWKPPTYASANIGSTETLPALFTQYATSTKLPAKTVDSWRTYVARAHRYLKGKPASVVTKQNIREFAEALQQGDKAANPKGQSLAAKTVNDNYIAVLSAVYKWAIEREKLNSDPTKGVRVKSRASETKGIEQYTSEQVATLLSATRKLQPTRVKRETANLRRWAPWLSAFTGARISEILWLRKGDVRNTKGVYYISIQPDTDGGARSVKSNSSKRSTPLHPAIIEEGFIEYWQSLAEGDEYLFPGDWSDKNGDRTKTPANKLRDWLKEQLPDADWSSLSPNHSFRHWLVSECRTAKIDSDRQRVITGHEHRDVHGRYGSNDVLTLYNDLKTIQSPLPPLAVSEATPPSQNDR
jgi:integrase